MNFEAMQADTYLQIREATGSGAGVYFGANDVKDALNDGLMEMSDETEWLEEYVEIDLLASRPYYDLFTLIGPTFLSLKPAFHVETNRWMIPSTVRALDTNDPRWERVVGTPVRIYMRGLRWMGLFPKMTADLGTLKTYYTRLPVPLVLESDEPGFPDAFHQGCVSYAMADLFAQDGEPALAVKAWKDYLEYEAGLKAWVQGRQRRPAMHVMGAHVAPR